jgi:spore photoproduct lyase
MSPITSTLKVVPFTRRRGSRKGASLPFTPEHVFVDRAVSDHPTTLRILDRLGDVEVDVVDDVKLLKQPKDLSLAKRRMILTSHKGRSFKQCQGTGEGHLCCGYRVLDLVSGCPMECSYCILQDYLSNNPVTTVYVNLEDILADVGSFLERNSRKFYRIGTGELSDSLALDPIIDYARTLIKFFASKPNAILELKTKTVLVDHLLDLKHSGRTTIAWSLNTPSIIDTEERGTASLDERLDAARRVAEAGFGVAFHFDPIVLSADVEADLIEYMEVVDRLLNRVPADSVSWVSLGLLRYPQTLPEHARRSFPDTRIFSGELVPAGGKVRYPKFMRSKVYKPLWDRLVARIPAQKLYLCMETPPVWKRVDEGVNSNSCIEKRVCNMEFIGKQ